MQPNSSLTPYLQPSDVLARADWRPIAQQCNDDPGTSKNPNVITYDQLLTNINFLTIINGACGKLESACLRSQIYSVLDLQTLNGMSQAYMFDILTALIVYGCYTRRSGPAMSETVINNYNSALKALDDLANGTSIFSFGATEQAGLPITYAQTQYDFIFNQNLVTSKWQRSFGLRNDVLRYGGTFWGGGGGWTG